MTWTLGPLTITRHSYGRLVISYTGQLTGPITRTVTLRDGQTETVTVAGTATAAGRGVGQWTDADVPFGAKVASIVYRAGSVMLPVPPEDRDWPILSDPFSGEAVSLIGAEIGATTYESATSVAWRQVTIGGDPLVTARPEQAPVTSLTLYSTTREARETLTRLLGPRRELLLRTPDLGAPDMWVAVVGARAEQRLDSRDADDDWRSHTLEAHRLSRPAATRAHATGATLGALNAAVGPTGRGRWATSGTRRTILDSSRYEAFPNAVRLDDGAIVAAWCSQTDHYARGGPSYGLLAHSTTGGATWSEPRRFSEGAQVPVALAARSGQVAMLAMTTGPYQAHITVTSTPLGAWPTPTPIPSTAWGGATWAFPSDLLWLDGDGNGTLIAAAYGGDGIRLTRSTDAGATWTPLAHPVTTPWGSPTGSPSEPRLTRLPDGRLLMMVRWDTQPTGGAIWALWSSDQGATWTEPVLVLPRYSGRPCVAVMSDGAVLMTLRDLRDDGSRESWTLAESRDDGMTWAVRSIGDDWMMYGEIVPTAPGAGLLIGATDIGPSSDVWALDLTLTEDRTGRLDAITARWATLGAISADPLIPEERVTL